MAFYNSFEDDELLQQQQQPFTTGPSPNDPSGQATQNVGGANAPDSPGNFVGIKKYLDANKSQAGKLGDQTAGVIGQSTNKAQESLSGLQNTFKQQVGSAPQFDENAYNQLNTDPGKLTDQQRANLKTNYDAQYSGPSSLQDNRLSDQYSDAQKNLLKARENVELADTEEGRQSLISQINNKPRTQGATTFDSVLLSSGGGRQKIADAAKQNEFVKDDLLGKANQEASSLAGSVSGQINTNRGKVQGAATNQATALEQAIRNALQTSRDTAATRSSQVSQDIADFDLDPYTLSLLQSGTPGQPGYKALGEGFNTYGVNLNDPRYFRQADLDSIQASNVASEDDYARAQALEQLMGWDAFAEKLGPNAINQTTKGQAGSANLSPSFDIEGIGNEAMAKGQEWGSKWVNSRGFIPPTIYAAYQGGGQIPGGYGGTQDDYVKSITGYSLLDATPAEAETAIIPKLRQAAAGVGSTIIGWRLKNGDGSLNAPPNPAISEPVYGGGSAGDPRMAELADQVQAQIDDFKSKNKKDTVIKKNQG